MTSALLLPLLGGGLIGLSATLYLLVQGRIAGISGIVGNVLDPHLTGAARFERVWFLVGLIVVGFPLSLWLPSHFQTRPPGSPILIGIAGLLVGIGTRMSSGCTSGHGVCGISRGSPRSIIATMTFIATGALAVGLLRALGGLS